jgi:hypothetical protein
MTMKRDWIPIVNDHERRMEDAASGEVLIAVRPIPVVIDEGVNQYAAVSVTGLSGVQTR